MPQRDVRAALGAAAAAAAAASASAAAATTAAAAAAAAANASAAEDWALWRGAALRLPLPQRAQLGEARLEPEALVARPSADGHAGMRGVEQVEPVELGRAARAQPRIEHRGQICGAAVRGAWGVARGGCGMRRGVGSGVRCGAWGVRCEAWGVRRVRCVA